MNEEELRREKLDELRADAQVADLYRYGECENCGGPISLCRGDRDEDRRQITPDEYYCEKCDE